MYFSIFHTVKMFLNSEKVRLLLLVSKTFWTPSACSLGFKDALPHASVLYVQNVKNKFCFFFSFVFPTWTSLFRCYSHLQEAKIVQMCLKRKRFSSLSFLNVHVFNQNIHLPFSSLTFLDVHVFKQNIHSFFFLFSQHTQSLHLVYVNSWMIENNLFSHSSTSYCNLMIFKVVALHSFFNSHNLGSVLITHSLFIHSFNPDQWVEDFCSS